MWSDAVAAELSPAPGRRAGWWRMVGNAALAGGGAGHGPGPHFAVVAAIRPLRQRHVRPTVSCVHANACAVRLVQVMIAAHEPGGCVRACRRHKPLVRGRASRPNRCASAPAAAPSAGWLWIAGRAPAWGQHLALAQLRAPWSRSDLSMGIARRRRRARPLAARACGRGRARLCRPAPGAEWAADGYPGPVARWTSVSRAGQRSAGVKLGEGMPREARQAPQALPLPQ